MRKMRAGNLQRIIRPLLTGRRMKNVPVFILSVMIAVSLAGTSFDAQRTLRLEGVISSGSVGGGGVITSWSKTWDRR